MDDPLQIDPTRLSAGPITIETLVLQAYGIADWQLVGAPAWLNGGQGFDGRYVIEAAASEPASREGMMAMLRQALVERCQLVVHTENRDARAYALTIAPGGPKLITVAGPGVSMEDNAKVRPGPGQMRTGFATTVSQLVLMLNRQAGLKYPVVDKTGLTGHYNIGFSFDLSLATLDENGRPVQLPRWSDLPIPSMLEQQMGLKLELQTLPGVQYVVIDHVEKPSEN